MLKAILNHLFLPASTFALVYIGQYHTHHAHVDLGRDQRGLRAHGARQGPDRCEVLWRHVVPNALLPTMTVIMMNLGFVLSGAILTETVFNWPGIGLLSYQSIMNLDYPVMQAVFLLSAAAVIVANLVADILYYYLDPRVRA